MNQSHGCGLHIKTVFSNVGDLGDQEKFSILRHRKSL